MSSYHGMFAILHYFFTDSLVGVTAVVSACRRAGESWRRFCGIKKEECRHILPPTGQDAKVARWKSTAKPIVFLRFYDEVQAL